MAIDRTKSEVICRIPNSINLNDLQNFADYFRYRNLRRNPKYLMLKLMHWKKEDRWKNTYKKLGV